MTPAKSITVRYVALLRLTTVVLALLSSAKAATVRADDHLLFSNLPIRGVVKAINHASLSTEQPMRVRELAVREGHAFRQGQQLVAFDCRRQRAELRSMAAQVREAELNLSSGLALDRHNAIGRNDVEIARIRLERANAEKSILDARVHDCEIAAPFDGRVVELSVRPLEFTTAQRPFLVIIDESRVELELIAPASVLSIVAAGDAIDFSVDELGSTVITARIKSIGAAVDPVSKTVKLIAAVPDRTPHLVAGMSGTAKIKAGSAQR